MTATSTNASAEPKFGGTFHYKLTLFISTASLVIGYNVGVIATRPGVERMQQGNLKILELIADQQVNRTLAQRKHEAAIHRFLSLDTEAYMDLVASASVNSSKLASATFEQFSGLIQARNPIIGWYATSIASKAATKSTSGSTTP